MPLTEISNPRINILRFNSDTQLILMWPIPGFGCHAKNIKMEAIH